MRPYLCLLVFMDTNWSLWVLISPYLFFWVLIGLYSSFYVRMDSNVSLWVFISPICPYGF